MPLAAARLPNQNPLPPYSKNKRAPTTEPRATTAILTRQQLSTLLGEASQPNLLPSNLLPSIQRPARSIRTKRASAES